MQPMSRACLGHDLEVGQMEGAGGGGLLLEIFYLFIYGLLPQMSACHGAIRVSYSLIVRPCTPQNNNNDNNIMFIAWFIYRKT